MFPESRDQDFSAGDIPSAGFLNELQDQTVKALHGYRVERVLLSSATVNAGVPVGPSATRHSWLLSPGNDIRVHIPQCRQGVRIRKVRLRSNPTGTGVCKLQLFRSTDGGSENQVGSDADSSGTGAQWHTITIDPVYSPAEAEVLVAKITCTGGGGDTATAYLLEVEFKQENQVLM